MADVDDPFVTALTHVSRYKWFYAIGVAFIAMLAFLSPGSKTVPAAPAQFGSASVTPVAGNPGVAGGTAPSQPGDIGALPASPDDIGVLSPAGTEPSANEEPSASESPPPPPPASGFSCATDASLPAPALSTALNNLASIQTAVAAATGQAVPDAAAQVAAALGCTGAPSSVGALPPGVVRALVGIALLGG